MIRLSKIALGTVSIVSVTLFSCKKTSTRFTDPEVSETKSPSSDKYYLVDPAEGKTMIDIFETRYRKTGINTQFVLNKAVLQHLSAAFEKNAHFDGASIYIYKKDGLILVPTQPASPPTYTKRHNDTWNERLAISSDGSIVSGQNESAVKASIQKCYADLSKGIHKSPGEKNLLSSAVWVDKSVFFALDKHQSELTHVVAFGATYTSFSTRKDEIGQISENQTTFILAPAKMSAGKYEPVWELGAFNHSQLCPQICN